VRYYRFHYFVFHFDSAYYHLRHPAHMITSRLHSPTTDNIPPLKHQKTDILSTDHELIPAGDVNVLSAVRGSIKHAGGRKTSYWSAIEA
jgi:hypothetical protein